MDEVVNDHAALFCIPQVNPSFADAAGGQRQNQNKAYELLHCIILGLHNESAWFGKIRRCSMIKVSVMYPNKPGARFNHEYYRDKHMPLVKSKMGANCKYYTVDKGLAGGSPGAPANYVGMCHIFCDSVEASRRVSAARQRDLGRHSQLHRPESGDTNQRSRRRALAGRESPSFTSMRRRADARAADH
jgi:uncharacterized protein (TIGR02118 family)